MKYLFSLLLLLSGWMSAWSQTALLRGAVVDKQTGEPLQGATVEIAGKESSGGKKKIQLLSGLDGTFIIRNLHAGEYKVKVNAVGYGKYEMEVNVGAGPLRIEMEKRQTELALVQVNGRHDRGSERASILADRKADIVQNSLSARAIELSPDLSVANTAQRVSGVSLERSSNGEGQYVIIRGMDKRYIYTLVNGIKIPSPDNRNRYVPLDIFPADMLDRLEMIKSLTPNMEADAIGGAVNMIMKDAPSKFSVNANVAGGYAGNFFKNDYTHFDNGPSLDKSPRQLFGSSYQAAMKDFPNNAFSHDSRHNPIATVAGLSLGGRVLHDKLGILVGASYQNNYKYVHSVFFATEADPGTGEAKTTSIQDRKYSIQQRRSGVHVKLDYKLNDKNKISVYGAWLNLMKNEYRFASDTNLNLARTDIGTGRISNTYRDRHDVQQIVNTTLKGEHQFGSSLFLDWTGAYSKATLNRPDEGSLNVGTLVTKDTTGKLNYAPQTLNESARSFTHSSDEDKSGYLNLTYRGRVGEVRADLSAGGMYRNKNRTSTFDDYRLRPAPGGQDYDGNVGHNTFEVFNGQGSFTNALNYTAKENVGAGYLMMKLDWDKFLITGGARLEHTDLSWGSNVPESVEGKTGDVSYYDVLPSGNIKYSFNKKQAVRLSYYSAISRPNFYEVIPHITLEGNAEEDYAERGNPDLKHTVADNLDLRYEYYPKGLDQLLVGAFYKRLKNPIEYSLTEVGTNEYYMADNFGNATNYGAELDVTKFWRSFGIRANYTYTNSSITTTKFQPFTIPGKDTGRYVGQTRPLQGQSKHIGNLSLLYKDDGRMGLNAQLAFSYTSGRINTVSAFYNNDIWQKGFTQMDFSAEKRLARHWYLYVKINNILNTPYELELHQPYTGKDVSGDVPYQKPGKNAFVRKDVYGVNYLLGVKFKI